MSAPYKRERPGDDLLLIGLFLWVWIVVGPWWVGLGLLVLGSIANYVYARSHR